MDQLEDIWESLTNTIQETVGNIVQKTVKSMNALEETASSPPEDVIQSSGDSELGDVIKNVAKETVEVVIAKDDNIIEVVKEAKGRLGFEIKIFEPFLSFLETYDLEILDLFMVSAVVVAILAILFVSLFSKFPVLAPWQKRKIRAAPSEAAGSYQQQILEWCTEAIVALNDNLTLVDGWLRSLNDHSKRGGNIQVTFESIERSKSTPPRISNVVMKTQTRNQLLVSCQYQIDSLAMRTFVSEQSYMDVKFSSFDIEIECFKGVLFLEIARNGDSDIQVSAVHDSSCSAMFVHATPVTIGDANETIDTELVQQTISDVILSTKCIFTFKKTDLPSLDSEISEMMPLMSDVNQVEADVNHQKIQMAPTSRSSRSQERRLLVKVIKANGLREMDSVSSSDPYCIVELDEPRQRHKTNAIRSTLSPYWDEHFLFDLNRRSQCLSVIIKDRDKPDAENFMGQSLITIESMKASSSTREILPLEGRPKKNDAVQGSITLELLFMEPAEDHTQTRRDLARIVETSRLVTPSGTHVTTVTTVTSGRPADGNTEPFIIVSNNSENNLSLNSPYSGTDVLGTALDVISNHPSSTTPPKKSELVITSVVRTAQDAQVQSKIDGEESMMPEFPAEETGSRQRSRDSSLARDKFMRIFSRDPTVESTLPPNSRRSKSSKRDPSPAKSIKKFFSIKRDRSVDSRASTDSAPILVKLQPKDGSHSNTNTLSRSKDTEVDPNFLDSTCPEAMNLSTDTGSIRSSGSQSSIIAYDHSTLVIETITASDAESVKYYMVSRSLAKSGKHGLKGNKLHIYNDHIFQATHFEASEKCDVCERRVSRRLGVGKQGYQCRDCDFVVHKQCHYKTDAICAKSSVAAMEMEYIGDPEDILPVQVDQTA